MAFCVRNSSPSGTYCSDSSTESHGRSPSDMESFSMDSLLSSLLQEVTRDPCNNCNAHSVSRKLTQAVARCQDCGEPLCENCVTTHRMARLNRNHRIQRYAGRNTPSPPGALLSPSPPLTDFPYCDVHRQAQRLYCEDCGLLACGQCGLNDHVGHVLVYLLQAIEGARALALQVLAKARVSIDEVTEDLDTVKKASDGLDQMALDTAATIQTVVRRIVSSLEDREKELLAQVENAKHMKGAALQTRQNILKGAFNRLTRTADILSVAVAPSSTYSPVELLQIKDRAATEVLQIRQAQHALPPHQDGWISFIAPDAKVLHAIASMGSVVVVNPGPVRDRRAVRGRMSLEEPGTSSGARAYFRPSPFIRGLGRPILGNPFPVLLRSTLFLHPMAFQMAFAWGSEGDSDGEFCRPWGVCCDKYGHVIIADRSNNRIQIFRQDGSFVRRFGSQGSGRSQFDRPAGVAIDAQGQIVVADKDNHRIQMFTLDGEFVRLFGGKGSRIGQFNYPWDVAVNTEGQIAVSDTRNHRVQLFSNEGKFLSKFGYEDNPLLWKQFDSPRGVAFNPQGCIVVTDFNNHRLLVIDPDFYNARFLGNEGSGETEFQRPQGVAVDDAGYIIVADSKNHRIQVFDPCGTMVCRFGRPGQGVGELDRPSGIALTRDGKIIVVDFGNNRVQLF